MGETPISEFELNNDDKYLAALNKQLDEIKALKEEEEKKYNNLFQVGLLKCQGVLKK